MTTTTLNWPLQNLRSARAGARPGDGTVRSLLDGEIFVNQADNVICMLSANGVMQTFYQLNAAGLAGLAAVLPTTDPGVLNAPWNNQGVLTFSGYGLSA